MSSPSTPVSLLVVGNVYFPEPLSQPETQESLKRAKDTSLANDFRKTVNIDRFENGTEFGNVRNVGRLDGRN